MHSNFPWWFWILIAITLTVYFVFEIRANQRRAANWNAQLRKNEEEVQKEHILKVRKQAEDAEYDAWAKQHGVRPTHI